MPAIGGQQRLVYNNTGTRVKGGAVAKLRREQETDSSSFCRGARMLIVFMTIEFEGGEAILAWRGWSRRGEVDEAR